LTRREEKRRGEKIREKQKEERRERKRDELHAGSDTRWAVRGSVTVEAQSTTLLGVSYEDLQRGSHLISLHQEARQRIPAGQLHPSLHVSRLRCLVLLFVFVVVVVVVFFFFCYCLSVVELRYYSEGFSR